jgi:hypothetical protein
MLQGSEKTFISIPILEWDSYTLLMRLVINIKYGWILNFELRIWSFLSYLK